MNRPMLSRAKLILACLAITLFCSCSNRSDPEATSAPAPETSEIDSATALAIMEVPTAAHFVTPDGGDTVIEPGIYEVKLVEEALQVSTLDDRPPILIAADLLSHEEQIEQPTAIALAGESNEDQDAVEVALLLPDGKYYSASGSISGVRARGLLKKRPIQTFVTQNIRPPCNPPKEYRGPLCQDWEWLDAIKCAMNARISCETDLYSDSAAGDGGNSVEAKFATPAIITAIGGVAGVAFAAEMALTGLAGGAQVATARRAVEASIVNVTQKDLVFVDDFFVAGKYGPLGLLGSPPMASAALEEFGQNVGSYYEPSGIRFNVEKKTGFRGVGGIVVFRFDAEDVPADKNPHDLVVLFTNPLLKRGLVDNRLLGNFKGREVWDAWFFPRYLASDSTTKTAIDKSFYRHVLDRSDSSPRCYTDDLCKFHHRLDDDGNIGQTLGNADPPVASKYVIYTNYGQGKESYNAAVLVFDATHDLQEYCINNSDEAVTTPCSQAYFVP